ncbi:cell division topological specificity factor MinE [Gluconobacter wancherniae]|uniref:Cell division topological specificity factor n=1 Tax=Gluconobacter wancherniae NBRC 103581 TaxID=656744 RepID=A0A511B169_9PROT|nr:cell division topological specificity factor MinE [Gluconobacter wancherniae]MBF0853976.1 cell division topological specificity factor MinE [Gluconobacter wancherniae]MBS1062362.1 cell division topological specificity factor MinE [Gluconobacter wancherniae]MBS1089236.1 cell division topological specificity factor MinE [Gluconobacter wancherniae]MBS1094404.1 cell division topological specificity factor MinE [Gluconobacter wancherniae]MBS1094507.1 cell division topological specificity factor 
MSFLGNLFAKRQQSSSAVARDRLQILLAHERGAGESGDSELIQKLHKEIMAVIARHIAVDQDKVQIKVDRTSGCSMLEIDVEVPQELLKKSGGERQRA